ncbi:MAG: hypothetical protein IJF44_04520 [Clostridia bacterium]|nr:hypothetical protein [Clostridia bacterium]
MKKGYTSPFDNLAPIQFAEIDEEFFNGYNIEYFDLKCLDIIQKLDAPESLYTNTLNKKFTVDGVTIENKEDIKAQDVLSYAKLDLVSTHYHCLESFMRLFIVLNKNCGCITLSLASLESCVFRGIVKNIAKGNFSDIGSSAADAILKAFIGNNKRPESITDKDCENWQNWVQEIAKKIVDSNANNSYKHGFYLQPNVSGVKISNEESPFVLEAKGDSLISYTYKEKNGRKVWVKRTKLVNYGVMLTEITIVSRMIRSMIEIRKLKGTTIQLYYPDERITYKEIEKLSINTKGISAILSNMEMELLYYQTPPKKSLKNPI